MYRLCQWDFTCLYQIFIDFKCSFYSDYFCKVESTLFQAESTHRKQSGSKQESTLNKETPKETKKIDERGDAPEVQKDLEKGEDETLSKTEKANGQEQENLAATTSENGNKSGKVVEKIKRSAKKRGKEKKRQSGGESGSVENQNTES